jgi:YbbR domain-containing protein
VSQQIKGAFTRNWTLKVAALGIALMLWLTVRFEAPTQQEIRNVAVRVDLSDPGWTLLDTSEPSGVTVRFRGPWGELARIAAERPTIVIPLGQVLSGDTAVVLQASWVRFGDRPGVVVEGLNPGVVRLRLEPVQRITLPPAVRLIGFLPDSLALAQLPVPSVTELRIFGPRSRTLELDSIPLLPVDLSRVTASGAVPVMVDTARVSGVQVQPISFELEFRVETRVERRFTEVPVIVSDPLLGLEIEGLPRYIPVRISGANSVLGRLDPSALRLVVDLNPNALPAPGLSFEVTPRLEGVPALLTGLVEIPTLRVSRRSPGGP